MGETELERIERKATEALNVGYEASRQINSHEDICALRYSGIAKGMEAIERNIDTLSKRMWIAAGSVIGACIAVIIFLAGKIQ